MCKKHDLFYMCGCRFTDAKTGEWEFEIEKCERAKRRPGERLCPKIDIALPIFAKDTLTSLTG
ncbi:hypothetical protein F4778DRAFT_780612 [Xylariomycetidae sp. FL2044]|nr:hypothetical protein F4778DRAFT_780612 [Xylariomycetidae sp. FL2044]